MYTFYFQSVLCKSFEISSICAEMQAHEHPKPKRYTNRSKTCLNYRHSRRSIFLFLLRFPIIRVDLPEVHTTNHKKILLNHTPEYPSGEYNSTSLRYPKIVSPPSLNGKFITHTSTIHTSAHSHFHLFNNLWSSHLQLMTE